MKCLVTAALAAELYTVEYHPVEHRADMEVKGDDVNISFLSVVPDTIRVHVEHWNQHQLMYLLPTPMKNQYLALDQILKLQISILRQRENACLSN